MSERQQRGGRSRHQEVLQLLSNPLRWQVMLAVLKARQLTAVEISEALNVNYDTLHKQTMLLRRSGLLDERFGEDRRYTVFSIPPAFTAIPGWLDFDVCRIRLPEDAAPPPPESGQEIEGVAIH